MRTAIFIDGAYVERVLRDHYGGKRIDYGRLANELGGSDLLRSYYYDAPPWQDREPTEEQRKRVSAKQRFFSQLSKLPRFEVRQGRCERRSNNGQHRYEQKRVDVLLSVDLVRLASKQQIRRALLFTGDSDFIPAVTIARDEGVSVELYHGPGNASVHRELWDQCDERYEIDATLVSKTQR